MRSLLFLPALFLLAACASAPQVERRAGFAPGPEEDLLFVVPFTAIMVPEPVAEGIFDRFVDHLNAGRADLPFSFRILKDDPARLDPQWLAQQYYITGELFGYMEESGCCSTSIQLKSRVRYHQPGEAEPTLSLTYPAETFFDHDASTLEAERDKLIDQVAAQLAGRLLAALAGT